VKKTLVKSFRIVVETQIVLDISMGGGEFLLLVRKKNHKVKEEGERSTLSRSINENRKIKRVYPV
jgi:hypothetical protein